MGADGVKWRPIFTPARRTSRTCLSNKKTGAAEAVSSPHELFVPSTFPAQVVMWQHPKFVVLCNGKGEGIYNPWSIKQSAIPPARLSVPALAFEGTSSLWGRFPFIRWAAYWMAVTAY